METVIQKELEYQKSKLNSNKNQHSWLKLFGLQQSTIEDIYRQQCIKELEKVLTSRQQLDKMTKNNCVVSLISKHR